MITQLVSLLSECLNLKYTKPDGNQEFLWDQRDLTGVKAFICLANSCPWCDPCIAYGFLRTTRHKPWSPSGVIQKYNNKNPKGFLGSQEKAQEKTNRSHERERGERQKRKREKGSYIAVESWVMVIFWPSLAWGNFTHRFTLLNIYTI